MLFFFTTCQQLLPEPPPSIAQLVYGWIHTEFPFSLLDLIAKMTISISWLLLLHLCVYSNKSPPNRFGGGGTKERSKER